MGEQVAIGIDIGGTKIAFALVNRRGEALLTHRLPTPVSEGPEAVFAQVVKGILHLSDQTKHTIAGIGIGSPGHLNPRTGVIHNATNLRWTEIPLLDGLRKYMPLEIPMWLQKDANAALIGEWLFGAAKGQRDFVLLTIGTGLGGGAMVEGKLVNGADNSGMEIGHMPLNASGRMCNCGMRGCPEMRVSGVGLLAGAKEYLTDYPTSTLVPLAQNGTLTTEAILDAFAKRDALAVRLMEDAADELCTVMIACMGILNPALFVIGGGLGHAAFAHFSTRTAEILQTRTRREIHRRVPIVESQVRHSAIGPACLVWNELANVS